MSVGSSLADSRRDRGMSVEDVSSATRIRAGLIREIENDDYHACGGDVYARGHIRSIARVVGVDPVPLIAEFDAGHHIEPSVVPAVPPESEQVALAHTERRRPNWTAAMVVALLVIIGVAAYGAVATGHHGPQGSTLDARAPVAPTTSSSPATPPTSQSPSVPQSAVAQVNPHKAILLVRATDAPTWLEVTESGTGAVLFQALLQPGQSKLFTSAAPLNFVIGNAPAVDVVVNHKDIGTPPSSGNVARGSVLPGSQQVSQA